jgi:hypothetical protein
MVVTIDVDDDLVRFLERMQMDRRPHRCKRGHWLLPGHMIVGSLPCSCGRHTTWECECSDVIYEPALTELCTLLNGRGGGTPDVSAAKP